MFSLFKRKIDYDYAGAAKQLAFIVGTGRCGSTILAQVLNSHSRICVPHELQILVSIGNGDRLYEKAVSGDMAHYKARNFIKLIDRCCPYYFEQFFDYKRHFKELSYPQKDLRQILKDLFDHICATYGKEVFIEQTPWHGKRLDVLKGLFPEMKVIHLVRDPRDVAISYARTPWWSKDVAANIMQWEREVNVIHDFGLKNPEGFLELRYEDLVNNPQVELGRMLALLDLPFEEEMLNPEKLINYEAMFKVDSSNIYSKEYKKWEQGRSQVFFTDSIYSWKKNRDYDFASLTLPIRETMSLFQYEP
jgi:Sulfotransferase family